MTDHGRYADRRGQDRQVGDPEHLARLVPHLQLLRREPRALGVGAFAERQHVEGDRSAEHLAHGKRARVGPGERLLLTAELLELLEQLANALLPDARRRLIRGRDERAQAEAPVQRRDRHQRGDRRAVPVRDQVAVAGKRLRVDLGDDERDGRIHAERGRIVDAQGAGAGRGRQRLARDGGAGRGERKVDPLEPPIGERSHGHVVASEGQPLALGPRRCEREELGDGEIALLEDPDHRAADGPGRADDADAKLTHRRRGIEAARRPGRGRTGDGARARPAPRPRREPRTRCGSRWRR